MYPRLIFAEAVYEPQTLKAHAEALADHLYQMGIRPDDVIGVMLRNEPALFEIILACQLLGAYFCTINWHYKEEETRHILMDSGAKVLFFHADLAAQIGAAAGLDGVRTITVEPPLDLLRQYGVPTPEGGGSGASTYSDYLRPIAGLARPEAQPRGALPYTSGSTGRPKGVLRLPVPPDEIGASQAARRELGRVIFGVDSSARALLSAPMYHSAPLSYALHCASEGATLYLESKFDPIRTLAMIERHRITHAYLVPTMYQRLLALPAAERQRFDLASLQFVASTGSPCAPETKRAMIEWFGPVIHEAYASSETGYITAIDSAQSLARPGSAGRAVLSACIRILGEDGREMAPGEVGLIYARQPAYPDFTYINNPAARQEMEHAGLVTLGDMGYLDEEGFLFVSDRKSDMVISGGVNIYPAEIEAVLNAMEGVQDCAVFGIPDPEFGEALAAAIEARAGYALTADQVRAFLAPRIASFKLPRTITFHASLPREDTGKIFKRRLRDPYWAAAGRRI